MINFDVPLTDKNVNANIKCNILSEDNMRKLGFADYNKQRWSLFIELHKKYNIEFSLSISKSNPEDFRIDILDSDWCQPYDYQSMIKNGDNSEFLINIHNKVQEIMKILIENNVISGYNLGDYI